MFHLIKTTVLPLVFHLIKTTVVVSTFHPFQWRNWTPQAMLYLKGASKLHINLVFRPVASKQNEATVPYFSLHLK
uniref:Uncharacterized protein n=1 Tax=Gadus morhua TaxID=8049 RepID=A0A8C5C610_GADMO